MNEDKLQLMSPEKEATNALASAIIAKYGIGSILYLSSSPGYGLFEGITKHGATTATNSEEIPKKEYYDLIVGDIPLGMGPGSWNDEKRKINVRSQKNWIEIFKSLFHLSERGIGLFQLEPHSLRTFKGAKFKETLENNGFYERAIFNAPSNVLTPGSNIQPSILLITREPAEEIFIAEISSPNQADAVIDNYSKGTDTNNLIGGLFLKGSEFQSFYQYKISKQIEKLETQYKEYDTYKMSDVALAINTVGNGEKFVEKEYAIYIPNIGNSPVIAKLDDARLKQHNYYQVILNEQIVKKEYLVLYFTSTIGRLVLSSLSAQTIIPHLNKSGLNDATIAVPAMNEQEIMVGTFEKLSGLKIAINEFEKELALNPTSSSAIREQLETMLDAVGMLSDADRIRAWIREGETRTIEFKQTLSLDIKTQKKEKFIEQSALKTVVAFLNTKGGALLIGVADDGSVHGVDAEIDKFYPSSDKFLLHFKNLLKNRVGEEFYDFIDYHFVNMDDNRVLLIDCKRAKRPCFLDETEFYVRANPATDRLEGRKLAEYLENHFKKE